jgi:hypothetical protein
MAEGKGHTELPPVYCFPIRASRKHVFVNDAQMRVIAEMADRPDREFWAKHIVTAVNTYPAVEGLVKAVSDLLRWVEPIAGDNRDDAAAANEVLTVEHVKDALSRFRSLQEGEAND